MWRVFAKLTFSLSMNLCGSGGQLNHTIPWRLSAFLHVWLAIQGGSFLYFISFHFLTEHNRPYCFSARYWWKGLFSTCMTPRLNWTTTFNRCMRLEFLYSTCSWPLGHFFLAIESRNGLRFFMAGNLMSSFWKSVRRRVWTFKS